VDKQVSGTLVGVGLVSWLLWWSFRHPVEGLWLLLVLASIATAQWAFERQAGDL